MNRGFTLIELLAVIIVLSLLAVLASTSITKIVRDSKKELYESQIASIKSAVETWGADNPEKLPDNGQCKYLTLGELKEYGLLDSKIINPKNNKDLKDDMIIKISSNQTSHGNNNITYEVGVDDINGCTLVYPEEPKSFSSDSWDVIVANVRAGNLSVYKVGDTKEITLSSTDSNLSGTYTVRIANISNSNLCITEDFSQTACGFVVEFIDVITNYPMNSSGTNEGGWQNSEMRKYVNNDIYNSFPSNLKEYILDTDVVSGYEKDKTENYKTKDKLYLLSPVEVWGKDGSSNIVEYDSAEIQTRQLDYYKNLGVTTSNYKGAIKKDSNWWLRTPYSLSTSNFYNVKADGSPSDNGSNYTHYISVAFRI